MQWAGAGDSEDSRAQCQCLRHQLPKLPTTPHQGPTPYRPHSSVHIHPWRPHLKLTNLTGNDSSFRGKISHRKQQGNFLGKSVQISGFLAGPGPGPGSLRDMHAVALGSGLYGYSQRKRHGLATRATSPRTFCHHLA
jgi:hypothetical protein